MSEESEEMDNGDKVDMTAAETAYDPDAAELLKDLEEDDEEDTYPSKDDQRDNPLVNLLTSSANLESLTTLPSMSQIGEETPSAPAQDVEHTTTFSQGIDDGASRYTQSDDEQAKTEVNLPSVPSDIASHTDAASHNEELSDTASNPVPPKNEKRTTESKLPSLGRIKSIVPFETKRVAKKIPDEVPPEVDEAGIENPTREDPESLPGNRSSSPGNKRPPLPPRSSSASTSSAHNGSIPAESALSQESISEMLAGGKRDEAPDLAAFKYNDNNWYAQIFNEDYFRTIPKSSPRQTQREASFIIERLGIQSGARVLDLCCGYGRHTIALAKHGFDMVGLDLSMVMLKKALAEAQAAGLAIKFVHGDMRKLNFKAIFDAIYCVQTSFGYFDELSNFKVLQGIFRALKPGGIFLIETINRDFLIDELPMRLWWKGSECMLLEEIDMESLSGILKVARSFVFDGNSRQPWEQKIQIRLYSVTELRALLMRAGFNVIDLSGDYALPGAFFGAQSQKIIMVAEKPVRG